MPRVRRYARATKENGRTLGIHYLGRINEDRAWRRREEHRAYRIAISVMILALFSKGRVGISGHHAISDIEITVCATDQFVIAAHIAAAALVVRAYLAIVRTRRKRIPILAL